MANQIKDCRLIRIVDIAFNFDIQSLNYTVYTVYQLSYQISQLSYLGIINSTQHCLAYCMFLDVGTALRMARLLLSQLLCRQPIAVWIKVSAKCPKCKYLGCTIKHQCYRMYSELGVSVIIIWPVKPFETVTVRAILYTNTIDLT